MCLVWTAPEDTFTTLISLSGPTCQRLTNHVSLSWIYDFNTGKHLVIFDAHFTFKDAYVSEYNKRWQIYTMHV